MNGHVWAQFASAASPNGGRTFNLQALDYIASIPSASAPVPEPATLLLFATGAAGIVARARSRRQP